MRYITNLPSTPQMARYTAAPSSYTDPTVAQSVEPWWGSSLGGCGTCGLGQEATPAAAPAATPPTPASTIPWPWIIGAGAVVTLLLLLPKKRRGSSKRARDIRLGRAMRAAPYESKKARYTRSGRLKREYR
jgi:hypothetical protein